MKVTYYLEVLSSWCHWAEPTWTQLQERFSGRVAFDWKIALMNPGDFPASREQCDWFYRRSGTIMRSRYRLNSGWLDAALAGHYEVPNHVAEAARSLGVNDDRVRLSLAEAALREGKSIGQMAVAVEVASKAAHLEIKALRAAAESDAVHQRVAATTAEFHARGISQRPAFLLEDGIGDQAIFSGLVAFEPLAATIEAMLSDTAAYASHAAHFGKPPAV